MTLVAEVAAPTALAEMISLLPDTGGEITTFAVDMRKEWFDCPAKLRATAALMRSLTQNGGRLLVVVPDNIVVQVDAWLKGLQKPYELIVVPKAQLASGSIWPRDTLLAATGDNGAMRLLRPAVGVTGDWYKWLASHLGATPIDRSDIFLEGGDSMRSGDGLWLIGANAISETRTHKKISWPDTVQYFASRLGNGKPPIVVGYRLTDLPYPQPLQWLLERQRVNKNKLANSAIGRHWLGQLLLPALALAQALREATDPLKQTWAHIDLIVSVTGVIEDNKPVVLVAKVCPSGCARGSDAKTHDDYLDSVCKVLTESGCKVIRNPAPFVDSRVAPYNNVILQTNPRRVWLPVFGDEQPTLKTSDDENVAIWESLGFEVVRVPHWDAFLPNSGSMRCWTLPLVRK